MEPKAQAYRLTIETKPDPDEIQTVRAGLSNFNRTHAGEDSFSPLTLLIRDEQGAVVGGLLGGTYWGWLYVEILWIAESARHQGLGSQLLHEAEQIALQRGCLSAFLDTMSFQAPGFYEKHGYSVFGVLEGLPTGHRRIYYQKRLAAQPAEPG